MAGESGKEHKVPVTSMYSQKQQEWSVCPFIFRLACTDFYVYRDQDSPLLSLGNNNTHSICHLVEKSRLQSFKIGLLFV